jgi:hypothetical protein
MMSCHDVAVLVSTGQLMEQPWRRRLLVRMHVLMCRYCRAFVRQLEIIDRAAAAAAAATEREMSADLHARVRAGIGLGDDSA